MKTLLALLTLVSTALAASPATPVGAGATAPIAARIAAPVAAPVTIAAAQEPQASSRLYAREESGRVRVAVEVALRPSWHLYHGPTKADMGPEDAVGKPTTLRLSGIDVAWEPVEYPEPERAEQDLGFGDPTWIRQHSGTFVLRAEGAARGAVDLAQLVATIDGLTCSDVDGRCIPYGEELKVAGPGADALFAARSGEGAASAGHAPSGGSASPAPGGSAPAFAQDDSVHVAPGGPFQTGGAPLFGRDLGGGFAPGSGMGSGERVDGTLWVRPVDGELRAVIRLVVAPGWHVYHGPTRADIGFEYGVPTTVDFTSSSTSAALDWGPVVYPEPERVAQDVGLDEPVWANQHGGTVVLYARAVPGPGGVDAWQIGAIVAGQVCSDDGTCVPVEIELASAGPGSDEVFADFPVAAARGEASTTSPGSGATTTTTGASTGGTSTGGASTSGASTGGAAGDTSLWLFLLAAVGWGLFTLLMPCTYPMIPITISFFTKQATAREKSVLPLALAYGLGIVAIFVLIGVVVGPVIIQFATHPVTNLVIGLLFVFFALALFGAIDLQPPAFLMSAAGKASMRGGYVGVFLMGATLVVTSFTCTAPFVGSLLSLGATQGGVGRIALGMAVFGATMAIPFVLLSLVPGRVKAMPRSGEWMHQLKVFLGFVEVAAALKFLSNTDLIWQWGWLSRELFLVLWLAIFGAAALFLFGVIRLQGEANDGVGPKRFVAGLATLLFAAYCGYGALGHRMDRIMTAIIPPYSNLEGGATEGRGGAREASHTIVVDDYERARRLAIEQGKGLFVNFTGHTCVNCRMMELGVFPRPEVSEQLEKYVEARLHTDGTTNIDEIRRLQKEMTQSVANPYYVIQNPSTGEILDRHEGATLGSPQIFVDFLRRNAQRARDFQTATAK